MTEDKKQSRESREGPPETGNTYRTASRAKTGVGNEPPVKDLREKGEESE